MTEEKLIEQAWQSLTDDWLDTKAKESHWKISGTVWEESFRLALRKALAAQRLGCAEKWLRYTFDDDIDERREFSDTYRRILNAEPDDV